MPDEHGEEFKEMELWEHLQELRSRLIRSALYIILGLVAAWCVYPWLSALAFAPLRPILAKTDGEIIFHHVLDGFMLQLQVSLVAGLILAIPLVTFELWGFVAPGLTRNERKACYYIFPLSVLFFFMGVVTGYLLIGVSVGYFVQFIPKDVKLYQDPLKYLLFSVKMVLAFGICFQMPVILTFLTWIGLVSSRMLRQQWRMAVVACFAVAALATPGGDPMTMCIMAAPLAVLYVGSIAMCTAVERMKAAREAKEQEQELSLDAT